MTGLIADIGATHARFALTTPDREWRDLRIYYCADFLTFSDAIRTYLKDVLSKGEKPPEAAAVAIPGPVTGDQVTLTNLAHWTFSIENVSQEFGFEPFVVINDFQANALAVPFLGQDHYLDLGGDTANPAAPVVIVGPGTGLGVSILMPDGHAVATEGGHVTLPVTTEREARIAMALIRRYSHSAAERAVSGPGLVNLARIIREIDGIAAVEAETPAEVMEGGVAGLCPIRAEAVSLFYAFLGSLCGNLVLTTGALGGLWLMGGILPRHPEMLKSSVFSERYGEKGRFKSYVEAVPRRLVIKAHPAFIGLTSVLIKARKA